VGVFYTRLQPKAKASSNIVFSIDASPLQVLRIV